MSLSESFILKIHDHYQLEAGSMMSSASSYPRGFAFFFILVAVLAFSAFATFIFQRDIIQARFCSLVLPQRLQNGACQSLAKGDLYSHSLGVASSIYVVSLARREDRRRRMELIREALGLRWQFSNALDKENQIVDNILYSVRDIRSGDANETFEWPEDSSWTTKAAGDTFNLDLIFPLTSTPGRGRYDLEADPILCTVENDTVPTYSNLKTVPLHLSLSRGMVACWYSHLNIIFRIAQQTSTFDDSDTFWDRKQGVSIVFEDDVDMEWDLRERLQRMWMDLPRDWDIVFLGHCWSNEEFYPPLTPSSPLHPSYEPKCTHGYALSPAGARKLASYLSYPPFAFSRAIDQAIAYLVKTQRLRAFSIVPSIVKQQRCEDRVDYNVTTKCQEDSDIRLPAGMKGSWWRDILEDSVLGRIHVEKDMF